jgi:hypothetical protein
MVYDLFQACQTQTHVGAALSYSKTKKLSASRSFEKFFKFYCSEALFYDNLTKNNLINVIMRSNKIAAGRIGQAMGRQFDMPDLFHRCTDKTVSQTKIKESYLR